MKDFKYVIIMFITGMTATRHTNGIKQQNMLNQIKHLPCVRNFLFIVLCVV